MKDLLGAKLRQNWIDIARGVAILSVVVGHINIFSFTQLGLAFQIPLFAIIAGILFKPVYPFHKFVRKNVLRLLSPYLTAACVSLLLWLFISLINPAFLILPYTTNYLLSSFLLGLNPVFDAALWFMPAFLLANILWWLAISFSRGNHHESLNQWMQILAFAILWISIENGYYIFFSTWRVPYSVDLAFILAAFLGIGEKFKKLFVTKWFTSPKMLIIFIPIFLWGTNLNGVVNFYGRNYGFVPLFLLNSLVGSFAVICFSHFLARNLTGLFKPIQQFFIYIGKESLFIFIYHWPALLILNTLLFNTGVLSQIHATQNLVTIVITFDDQLKTVVIQVVFFLLYTTWAIAGSLMMKRIIRKLSVLV